MMTFEFQNGKCYEIFVVKLIKWQMLDIVLHSFPLKLYFRNAFGCWIQFLLPPHTEDCGSPLNSAQASNLSRRRPKQENSDLCGSRPEPATSARAGQSKRPLQEQVPESNCQGSRPKTGTTARPGKTETSSGHPRDQVQARHLYGSRPKQPLGLQSDTRKL